MRSLLSRRDVPARAFRRCARTIRSSGAANRETEHVEVAVVLLLAAEPSRRAAFTRIVAAVNEPHDACSPHTLPERRDPPFEATRSCVQRRERNGESRSGNGRESCAGHLASSS
jgi:hypothetical protein